KGLVSEEVGGGRGGVAADNQLVGQVDKHERSWYDEQQVEPACGPGLPIQCVHGGPLFFSFARTGLPLDGDTVRCPISRGHLRPQSFYTQSEAGGLRLSLRRRGKRQSVGLTQSYRPGLFPGYFRLNFVALSGHRIRMTGNPS